MPGLGQCVGGRVPEPGRVEESRVVHAASGTAPSSGAASRVEHARRGRVSVRRARDTQGGRVADGDWRFVEEEHAGLGRAPRRAYSAVLAELSRTSRLLLAPPGALAKKKRPVPRIVPPRAPGASPRALARIPTRVGIHSSSQTLYAGMRTANEGPRRCASQARWNLHMASTSSMEHVRLASREPNGRLCRYEYACRSQLSSAEPCERIAGVRQVRLLA